MGASVTVPVFPAAIGIVLAGGAARRMQPARVAAATPTVRKEWVEIGGRTLLERVIAAVAPETSRTLVVTVPGRPLPPLPGAVEIVHDSAPGAGPLAAVLDGLRTLGDATGDPPVFVASCDLPLLRRDVVRLVLACAEASGAVWTVPDIGGHPQVLCSVVRRTLAGRIAAWLATGRRDPRGLLAELRREDAALVRVVGAEEIAAVDPLLESFRDVDTPAACAEIIRQLPYGDRPGGTYTPPP